MTDDLDTSTLPGGASGKHRSAGARRRRRPERESGSAGKKDDADAKNGGTAGKKKAAEEGKPKKGAFFRELVILVVLVLGLTALLRGLVFEAYVIPSGSMENTLQVGDRVLVNKLVYRFKDIQRGDVIVFDGAGSFSPEGTSEQEQGNPVQRAARWVWQLFGGTPANEEDFVKRVIGVPGDEVECRRTDSGFAMFVNGVQLSEKSYLFPGDQPCQREFKGKQAITVPKGRLWVMGDHRSLSADSREHVDDGHFGTVPEDAVIGRGAAIVWPTSHWHSLPRPDTFEQPKLRSAPEIGGDAPDRGPPGAAMVSTVAIGAGLVVRRRRTRL